MTLRITRSGAGIDMGEGLERVVDDLVDLRVEVTDADQCAVQVERALAGEIGPAVPLGDRHVRIARRGVHSLGVQPANLRHGSGA